MQRDSAVLKTPAQSAETRFVEASLAIEQTLRYAEELSELHAAERAQRRLAEQALEQLGHSYRTTVRALAAALELRDDQTGDHAHRVTDLGLRLARAVDSELADDPQLEYGVLLHDIGKIGVPDAVLLKPGALDAVETEQMRVHPTLGAALLARIPHLDGLARDVVAAHHERWDGAGYPHGLEGEAIPLGARMFAIVDAFDAMTTDRPYQRALPVSVALAELRRCANSQFEPRLVAAFADLLV